MESHRQPASARGRSCQPSAGTLSTSTADYLYRNVGGAWLSAPPLLQPEKELGIGGRWGTLRGNHLVLLGGERDYERPDYYEDSTYQWNVLRVYRQNTAGAFVYHARLNADYT